MSNRFLPVRTGLMLARVALLAGMLAGCASQQDIGLAISDVNRDFQAEYEAILGEDGIRHYKASPSAAFAATRRALTMRLGMSVESEDSGLGFLSVVAPAPRPLDLGEWRKAAEVDLPRMREIARNRIGVLSDFIRFEPEGLLIVVNAAVVGTPSGADLSLTMRMREVAPPKSGVPRREYAPPTGVRMGLRKIWAAIDEELEVAGRKPSPGSRGQ